MTHTHNATGAAQEGNKATGRPAPRPAAPRSPLAGRHTPPHPGAFLDTRFLKPLGISQEALAEGLGISRRRVNELVRGRRAISPDTAIRLGRYFGTGPEFWLSLQQAWDNYLAWRAWRATPLRVLPPAAE
ncbi:hypothetical protein DLREEDagrD3_00580 [Denitratisoma sp. agr-D3]